MFLTSSSETRHPAKAPSFSINWFTGCESPEIVNTTTGKPDSGMSRLSKQSFLKRFENLCEEISTFSGEKLPLPPLYCDAKLAVANYNVSIYMFFGQDAL